MNQLPATCNLLAALSYPPWTEDLVRESYMTNGGEKRIPFHVYIQHGTNICISSEHSIPTFQFNQLPQELQLHILTMCCPSTLFQLMHTSSRVRIEASKLFWAQQDVYFLVSGYWLLGEGAYPGCTFSDLAFLPHAQSIEVDFTSGLDRKICLRDDETVYIQHNQINQFWGNIQRTFPRVKQILFNSNSPKPPKDNKQPFRLSLQLLLRACPRHIKASTLCLEKIPSQSNNSATQQPIATWRRVVFQPSAIHGLWDKSEPAIARKTVLMPTRRFSGPVGRFRELEYLGSTKLLLQQCGLWPLIVEAIDRNYFDVGRNVPFTCPLPSCRTSFYKAGAWSIHAAEYHFPDWRRILEVAPETVRSTFNKRRLDLEDKVEEVRKKFDEIKNMWEMDNGARQNDIKRDWMEQLANETGWETDQNGEQSLLWCKFISSMDPID